MIDRDNNDNEYSRERQVMEDESLLDNVKKEVIDVKCIKMENGKFKSIVSNMKIKNIYWLFCIEILVQYQPGLSYDSITDQTHNIQSYSLSS